MQTVDLKRNDNLCNITNLVLEKKEKINTRKKIAWVFLAILFILSILSIIDLGVSFGALFGNGDNLINFFNRAFPLDFPPLFEIIQQTLVTLAIVICGTLLAVIISIPIAYFAANNTSSNNKVRYLARFLGVLTRAMPDAVLALIFAMVISRGALPGILALGIHSIGMISKLYADAIENIDEGPRLALRAAGASKMQEFWGGIFPQVLPQFVSLALLRNDINLRVSVILGFVGVYGLGYQISFAIQTLNYGRAIALALVMFLLCLIIENLSASIRKRIAGKSSKSFILNKTAVLLNSRKNVLNHPERYLLRPWNAERLSNNILIGIFSIVIVASIIISTTQNGEVNNFWQNLFIQLNRLFPPQFSEIGAQKIGPALLETVEIALAATLIAVVLSFIFGAISAHNIAPNSTTRNISRFLLVLVRGVPELILAIFLIIVSGLGANAAVFALAFGGVGVLAKLYADSFEDINHGSEIALKSVGANRAQIFASSTLTQSRLSILSSTFYILDSNIRAATVLGVVGAGGVGFMLIQSQTSNQQQMLAILLCVFALVLMLEFLAMFIQKALR